MKTQTGESDFKQMLSRVPEVTFYFWVIKVLATTVGETAADFLAVNLNFGLTVTSYIMSALLVASLVIQFMAKKYVPWRYWLAVVLISIVGTLITDNLVDNMGVSLESTTIVFAIALALTFLAWFVSEKTLSIHSIYTFKREVFYWLAILFTFALGTAAGDLLSEGSGLGYDTAGMIFAAGIVAVTTAYYFLKMNAVLAFWLAYILTRPLGASMGDLLSKPVAENGIGMGTVGTSALFVTIIFGLVLFLTITKKDQITISARD
ncbi:MAG TPA: hypothetical protein ENK96_00380 [Desulfobulbaceae bacterium]|nr:hypothetical protein [Desulfobulbaceae bacterium]